MLLGAAFALLIARVGNAALLASEHSPATTISQKDAAADQAADAEKRSDAEDVDKYQMLQEGLASSKHLRYPDAYLEGLLQQQELMEKRASMRGFQGMRGKKSAGDYYYNEPAYYAYGAAGPPDYYYDKRAPMGFQGMRGKKSSYDEDEGTGKRAPMGFQGMRGKKSLEEVLDELEKRAMMGFHGMRGKKSEADYEDEAAAAAGVANQVAPAMSEGQWQKRAPMGFQGMRGRKSSGFLEELDELDKRAILGFHGMRGKKDMGYEREELDAAAINGYGQKRPMMMGFHGMRGKRSAGLYGLSLAGLEKRSPYRFFGTRGKKNPRWEMRGKFVGVRGKKWTAGPPRPLGPAIYDEDELQALYAASILGRTAAGLAATRR